jgi:ectoine hydroxylase-related dioxygenase (phytanoyl-CoA dioxygenase family)
MITIPKPTSSKETAAADLERFGVAILVDVLSSDEVTKIRRLVVDAADAIPEEPRSTKSLDHDTLNRRVRKLFNIDPVFIDLAVRDEARLFVNRALGDEFLISNFSANLVGPGAAAGGMHADQRYALEPWPDRPLAVNVGWLLDDFTDEVGATRFVPDSHLLGRNADPDAHYEVATVEAPAGSILVMDGRLWHQAGANRTADRDRVALFCYYVLPWIRPQVNWNTALDSHVVGSMSDEFLDLLGYHVGLVDNRVVPAR